MSDDRDLNKHLKTVYTVRNLHLHKPFENPRLSVTIYKVNQQYQHIMSTPFTRINSKVPDLSAEYLWHEQFTEKLQMAVTFNLLR